VPQHLSLAVELPEGWTAISPADFAPGGRRRIVLARWRYFVGKGGDEPTLTAITIIAPGVVADEVRAGADRVGRSSG
jgi:leucyl aminopeptidase